MKKISIICFLAKKLLNFNCIKEEINQEKIQFLILVIIKILLSVFIAFTRICTTVKITNTASLHTDIQKGHINNLKTYLKNI